MRPILSALIAFGLSFAILTIAEVQIHKRTKNKDKSYRWGVYTFSILIAIYTYLTSLGR